MQVKKLYVILHTMLFSLFGNNDG